jgi:hypothetical protein
MAVYQGSLTVKRRPKDGVPGNPGTPGLPGQIPIQKEWVVGDTHRFNDEIKDFIYVRGTSQNDSYWYTRTNKGDVVAGPPPVGGANVEGYTKVGWMRNLAVKVLLAEEANLANFIFKDEKLISVRGTVNGVETNYSGQAGFKPYIILDGKTGKIYAEGAEISGVINALSGAIGGLIIKDGKLILGNVGDNRIELDPSSRRIIFTTYDDFNSGSIGFDAEGALLNLYKRFSASTVYSSSVRVDGYSVLLRKFDQYGNETDSVTISPIGVKVSNASNTTEIKPDGIYINGYKVL